MGDVLSIPVIDDSIDFSAYLAEPEAKDSVKPVDYWQQRVIDRLLLGDEAKGVYLPWGRTTSKFRVRRSELTLWPGINGHGKSLLLSQVMLAAAAQGEKILIASMEMRPELQIERMTRQTSRRREYGAHDVRNLGAWAQDRIWIYDHVGAVAWKNLLGVCRWAVDKLGITQIVIDSLMRCGIADDDYNGQKAFVDALCTLRHDLDVGIHLVMHSRKRDDEMKAPGKFDAKGSGTMGDLTDNIMTVWRNKRKEIEREKSTPDPKVMNMPDALLICDKQRNHDWEGRISLWYHADSMQFIEGCAGQWALPIDLMEFGA